MTTSFEVCVCVCVGLGIWLFSLCCCLKMLDYWTFLESLLSGAMHVYKFQVAEKDLSPAAPDCTARIHHKEFADNDLLRFL